jgi:hypothetical protein
MNRVALASRWLAPAVLVVVFLPLTLASQSRDPEAVLAAMRQAMGANVDTVRAFSVSGSLMRNIGIRKSFSIDLKALLPEHYLSVHRDVDGGGFRPIDITYFNGFAGGTLIRRVDSNIPFPPDPGPNTAQAVAERQRAQMLRLRQEFARFCLILLGRSVDAYPLTFADGGTTTVSGRPVDVVMATATDGHTMRLLVDATTRLPVAITWEAPPPMIATATMTSTMTTTSSGQVVSQSPPVTSAPFAAPPAPTATVVWKVEVSDFKTDNGVNWPRRFKVTVADKENDEYRFGRYKINPKLEPKDFSIR